LAGLSRGGWHRFILSSTGKMACIPLPLHPPPGPMLGKSVKGVPEGNYLYEPEWDGLLAC
jgi:hypothetical protein